MLCTWKTRQKNRIVIDKKMSSSVKYCVVKINVNQKENTEIYLCSIYTFWKKKKKSIINCAYQTDRALLNKTKEICILLEILFKDGCEYLKSQKKKKRKRIYYLQIYIKFQWKEEKKKKHKQMKKKMRDLLCHIFQFEKEIKIKNFY